MATVDRKKLGRTNKQMGSRIERLYVKIFKGLGYSFCASSRLKSRALDNAKIDLADIPYNIQIKAGKQQGMNPGKELMLMYMATKEIFPPDNAVHSKPFLLIHHRLVSSSERMIEGLSSRRAEEESLVYMTIAQFQEFTSRYPHLTYSKIKEYKHATEDSPFKSIVCITFDYFKNNILNNDLQIYQGGSTSLLPKSCPQ